MTAYSISKHIPSYSLTDVSNKPGCLFEARRVGPASVRNIEQMFVPHRKDYYFFFLVKKGGSYHWVDFLRYQVQPHCLYFTLPHQVHLKERTEPMEGMLVAFTEEFLALCNDTPIKQLPILQNKSNKHALPLTAEDEAFLDTLYEQIVAEFEAEETFKTAALHAYIKILLVYISRIYTRLFDDGKALENGNAIFNKFSKLIDKKYNVLHHPSGYAEALHITAGHLNNAVKTHAGKTATEFIQERLLLEAKRLLFHSNLSVKEVAYALGFEDAAYFNRLFKKGAGVTPLHFREQSHEKYHLKP